MGEVERMEAAKPIRVYVYIDGCNLHQGMKTNKFHRHYWLDLWTLATAFLRDGQELHVTKYFTARITTSPDKSKRQNTYIDALMALGQVEVIEGNFFGEPVVCHNCKIRCEIPKEKQTDTNIATEMVADAFLDRWDQAIVVSGDSDLVPPVKCIRKHFPGKRVLVAIPPSRHSKELTSAAHGSFYINEAKLTNSQLPDEVRKGDVVLKRPDKWK
jgi:uncharacterized LabA/DUF88 family protein